MATINDLVMDDSISDLIFGPLGIDGVCNLVILASKYCNRNVFYFMKRDLMGVSIREGVVGDIGLESVLDHVLAVVPPRPDRCAVGKVAVSVNIKSIIVVNFGIRVEYILVKSLALCGKYFAKPATKRKFPIVTQKFIDF